MSWKFYSLGNLASCSNIANAAKPKLEALGYTVAYTNSSNTKGVLNVTIGGVDYSCGINIANQTAYQTYLMVNDETNEIVIGQTGRAFSEQNHMCYLVSMALLRGTNPKTGAAGTFALGATDMSYTEFTNGWCVLDNTTEQIYLQRAVFVPYVWGDTTYVANPFVTDNIYWGTACYTPGVTLAVGDDTFVCINGCMFAKL